MAAVGTADGVVAVARALPILRAEVLGAEAPVVEDGSVSSCSLAVRPAALSPACVSLPEPIQPFPEESPSDAVESIARKVLADGLASAAESGAEVDVVAADGIRTAVLMHVTRQQFPFETLWAEGGSGLLQATYRLSILLMCRAIGQNRQSLPYELGNGCLPGMLERCVVTWAEQSEYRAVAYNDTRTRHLASVTACHKNVVELFLLISNLFLLVGIALLIQHVCQRFAVAVGSLINLHLNLALLVESL